MERVFSLQPFFTLFSHWSKQAPILSKTMLLCTSPHLNILGTISVKQHYSKTAIHHSGHVATPLY